MQQDYHSTKIETFWDRSNIEPLLSKIIIILYKLENFIRMALIVDILDTKRSSRNLFPDNKSTRHLYES